MSSESDRSGAAESQPPSAGNEHFTTGAFERPPNPTFCRRSAHADLYQKH